MGYDQLGDFLHYVLVLTSLDESQAFLAETRCQREESRFVWRNQGDQVTLEWSSLNASFLHQRRRLKGRFDFPERDVLSELKLDEIFLAIDDLYRSVGIHLSDVTSVEPSRKNIRVLY